MGRRNLEETSDEDEPTTCRQCFHYHFDNDTNRYYLLLPCTQAKKEKPHSKYRKLMEIQSPVPTPVYPMPLQQTTSPLPSSATSTTFPVGALSSQAIQPTYLPMQSGMVLPRQNAAIHPTEKVPQAVHKKAKPVHLPKMWQSATDAGGNVYYYHSVRRQSQWDPPSLDEVDDEDDSESIDIPTSVVKKPSRKHAIRKEVNLKKPPSSFLIFFQDYRKEVMSSTGRSITAKQAALVWNSMETEKRTPFIERQKKERMMYEKKKEEYEKREIQSPVPTPVYPMPLQQSTSPLPSSATSTTLPVGALSSQAIQPTYLPMQSGMVLPIQYAVVHPTENLPPTTIMTNYFVGDDFTNTSVCQGFNVNTTGSCLRDFYASSDSDDGRSLD